MRKIVTVITLLALGGCSHSNVGSKWDCPAAKGYPCINISQADEMATRKLSEVKENEAKKEREGKLRKIWFNDYKDSNGNVHEASIVNYVE